MTPVMIKKLSVKFPIPIGIVGYKDIRYSMFTYLLYAYGEQDDGDYADFYTIPYVGHYHVGSQIPSTKTYYHQ